MKNLAILVLFVLTGFTVNASENTSTTNLYRSNYGDTFTFVEQNVSFSVFPNGEFDFFINPQGYGTHANVNFNGVSISYNSGYNYDEYVQYDDYGAIIQIENLPIYYDYYGRISRAGNVKIRYNHRGYVSRVGGLNVYYNNHGRYSHCTGFINVYNRNYVYHPYHNWFARPLFDFRIVSHIAYRKHFNPVRYKYHKNRGYHYNNKKYYSKKRATNKIPNRKYNNRERTYNASKRVAQSTKTIDRTKNGRTIANRNITKNRTQGNKVTNRNNSRTIANRSGNVNRIKSNKTATRNNNVRKSTTNRSTVTRKSPVQRSNRVVAKTKTQSRNNSYRTAPKQRSNNNKTYASRTKSSSKAQKVLRRR